MQMAVFEFRLLTSLAKREWLLVIKQELPIAPKENDIVNINGNPYVVHRVGYAFGEGDAKQYVYVELFKAGSFKLSLGGFDC